MWGFVPTACRSFGDRGITPAASATQLGSGRRCMSGAGARAKARRKGIASSLQSSSRYDDGLPVKAVQIPSAVFIRSLGASATITSLTFCAAAAFQPALLANFSHPLYVALSSFFMGVSVAQFDGRQGRYPVVTVCISLLLRALVPITAAIMCRCFRFDQLTTAGFALLTVGPVSLSPLPAMNCAEMYVNFLAAVSRATYLSAFLSVPLCLYLSTFGAVKISAVFVLSLLSGPFLLGMGVYQNLSVPSAAILGRISLALSWLFLLPQLLSTVRLLSP